MLLITKGQTKFWYLTLTEKVTISNPKFLFYLTHRQTNKTYAFILSDVSTFTERYNKFSINENTYDFFEGEYMYEIYAQTSTSNLNPALANEQVESGILKVQLSSTTTDEYNPTLIEKIYE
jgi:hypothetical protein